jgi:hypothetical protein
VPLAAGSADDVDCHGILIMNPTLMIVVTNPTTHHGKNLHPPASAKPLTPPLTPQTITGRIDPAVVHPAVGMAALRELG